MNKVLVSVLAAAVLVLGLLVVRQQARISALEKERVAAPSVADDAVPTSSQPVTPAKSAAPTIAAVESTVPVAPPPPAPVHTPAQPADEGGKKPNMGDFLKNIGSMMTNDAMKSMIRTQSRMQLGMQYGRLFAFLNKPAETTEALKDLLIDRQMALMDSGLALMDGKLSPEERKQKADEIKSVKEAFDKKIASLLGTEDYDAFKQYEDTQPERMQVDMLKGSLSATGEPLTEQQEYDLVNAMYQARTNSAAAAAMPGPDTIPDPSQFTQAGLKKAVENLDLMQKAYAASAQKILTPAQYAGYQKHQEQQKQMNEIGMKFAAEMFGGDTNATPANVKVHVQATPTP